VKNDIIIVGGNSFVGNAILPQLIQQFDNIHVVCRKECNFDPHPKIKTYITEYPDTKEISDALEQCKFGLYFASATKPITSATDPELELNSNVKPLVAFLNAFKKHHNFTLIYLSSGGTVYGNAVGGPIKEQQPFSPRSYYAAGKIACESFVHAFSRQTGNYAIILRPSNFYGVGQPFVSNFGLIRTVFDHILRDEPITIWGDGESRRDFLYIDDFISACLFLLKQKHTEKVQTFNVSYGESISLNRICDLIEQITARKLQRIYKPIRQIDVINVELDSTKLRELGWKPRITIEHGLQLMWEWIKNK